KAETVESRVVRHHDGVLHLSLGLLQMSLECADDVLRELLIVERPAHEPGIVMPAALEALAAQALFPIRQALLQGVERPRVVVPVNGAGYSKTRFRQQQGGMIQIMEVMRGRDAGQGLAVDLE